MTEFITIGYSQSYSQRQGRSSTGCSVFAFYYAVIAAQLRENLFNSALLSQVVDFATPLYHQYLAEQRLPVGRLLTGADAAKATGMTIDIDYNEVGGLVTHNQLVDDVEYKSLDGALAELDGDFFGVLTIGLSSRAVARVAHVYYLIDSHGSVGNGAVPLGQQTPDRAVCLRFDSRDLLMACINSFRAYSRNEHYSLTLLNASGDTLKNLFRALNDDQADALSTTTTSSATTTVTYASVAAAGVTRKSNNISSWLLNR